MWEGLRLSDWPLVRNKVRKSISVCFWLGQKWAYWLGWFQKGDRRGGLITNYEL